MSSDWPSGTGRLVLEEVDSTNAEARRRVGTLTPPTWILARRQTAARGRRGRRWESGDGNFAASLLCRPPESADRAALLSFVAALALYDALTICTRGAGMLALKWPNDVLLNGGKVAGILLESAGTGRCLQHLVLGIGINLRHAPDAADVEKGAVRPASVEQETGLALSAEDVLTELARTYADREAEFEREGFAGLRDLWLARATRLGERISVRTGGTTLKGRFETVDASGALVLDTAGGCRTVAAADVYF